MQNNISFKSNINFVSSKKFLRKFKKGKYIDFIDLSKDTIESPEFYTMQVKTCTAGGFIMPKTKSIGFHFNDAYEITPPVKKGKSTTFERGLLIGSKKTFGYVNSLKNFKKLKDFLDKRLQALSVFERHRYEYSQSNIHYSLDTDTWTINTQMDIGNKRYDVYNLKTLIKAFKNIKIAKGDKLFFEGKEVLPEDFPAIFECVEKSTADKIIDKLIFALARIIP